MEISGKRFMHNIEHKIDIKVKVNTKDYNTDSGVGAESNGHFN